MLLRVANNPALPNFSSAYFKLRLDERYQLSCGLEQWNDSRKDFGCGDKRDVHHNQIKPGGKVLWFDVARVDAFSNFDSIVGAQSPVYLIVPHVEGDNAFGAVLQKTVSKAAG